MLILTTPIGCFAFHEKSSPPWVWSDASAARQRPAAPARSAPLLSGAAPSPSAGEREGAPPQVVSGRWRRPSLRATAGARGCSAKGAQGCPQDSSRVGAARLAAGPCRAGSSRLFSPRQLSSAPSRRSLHSPESGPGCGSGAGDKGGNAHSQNRFDGHRAQETRDVSYETCVTFGCCCLPAAAPVRGCC